MLLKRYLKSKQVKIKAMKTLNRILVGVLLVMLVVFGIGSCMKHESRPCGNCGDGWIHHKYVHHLGGKVCPQDLGCLYEHENPPCTIHLFEEVGTAQGGVIKQVFKK
jgi:hypothetical protein